MDEYGQAMMRLSVPDEACEAVARMMIHWDWDAGSDDAKSSAMGDARALLEAALPFQRFIPTGDNHHNALACPYCNPIIEVTLCGSCSLAITGLRSSGHADSSRVCANCGGLTEVPHRVMMRTSKVNWRADGSRAH